MGILVENLSVELNEKKIIGSISLDSQDGRFIGILGPNGSGKSTFLRTLYRVEEPSAGKIFLHGKEMRCLSLAETAREIAVVGQFNQIDFSLSVLDIVLMGRFPHKKWQENYDQKDYGLAVQALQYVGLENFQQSFFSALSGGEKQRVVLARALAQQPQILLLDEPTNHLDIRYQLHILSLVKALGITVIAVLHDLNLAAMYCDYLYILNKGTVFAEGTPKAVLTVENIKAVYQVDCEVSCRDKNEQPLVSFYPPSLGLGVEAG